jgi:hypothetical protein
VISADPTAQAELREAIEPHLGWHTDDQRFARLNAILSTVEARAFPGAVIPVIDSQEPRLRFYALASGSPQWRQLQPLLSAFVGMTLTDFDGRTLVALSGSGPEKVFGERGLVVAQFSASPDRKVATHAVGAVERLVNLTARAPDLQPSYSRPAPELLYAFDLALVAGNQDGASEILLELERRQLLDVINLRFMQVRLDAEFQEWQLLRSRPWFSALCRIRRPTAVTAALIKALYVTEISELQDESSTLVDTFASRVFAHAGDLFHILPERRDPMVTTAFLLQALASDDAERVAALRNEVTVGWPEALRLRYERLLTDAAAPPGVVAPPTRAEGIPQRLAAAANLSTLELLELLVESANSGALQGQQVVHQIAALLEERNAAQAIPTAIEVPEQPVSTTWAELFSSLPTLDHATARRIAEQAADEWPIKVQLPTPADVASLIDAVERAITGPQSARALAVLPHLIRWVHSDPDWPNPDLSVLYDCLLTTLILSDARRPDTFQSALILLDGLLGLGMRSDDYSKILGDLRAELRPVASANTIDLLLDAAELTTLHPSPDEAARVSFWAEVVTLLEQYAPAVTPAQRKVVQDLGRVLGAVAELRTIVTEPRASDESSWRGTIAIYTLREEVAHRAKDVLCSIFPNADVETCGAHVATDALRRLATADILVVAWSAAKHAATEALKRARSESIIWVSGGASSVVAAVTNRIAELE